MPQTTVQNNYKDWDAWIGTMLAQAVVEKDVYTKLNGHVSAETWTNLIAQMDSKKISRLPENM